MSKIQRPKKINPGMDKKTGLRPWQKAYWKAMVGCCPEADNYNLPTGGRLTPDVLWNLACLYFAGEELDTMIKKDFIRSGESAGKIVEMTTTRPFSWTSFGLFLLANGIKGEILNIKSNRDDHYPEFKEVIARIDNVIYQQKFDGAAIGGFNPQLIIRDLGLAEKVDANLKQEQPLFVDTPQPPAEE